MDVSIGQIVPQPFNTIQPFTGKEDIHDWLFSIRLNARLYKKDESMLIISSLQGHALKWLREAEIDIDNLNLNVLRDALIERFQRKPKSIIDWQEEVSSKLLSRNEDAVEQER
jgi:hypothetical protein